MGELHEKHEVQRGIWVPTQHLIKTTSRRQSNTTIYSQKTLHVSITKSISRLNRLKKKKKQLSIHSKTEQSHGKP